MHKSFDRVMEEVTPEFKSFPLHVKAGEGRTVTTLFSVFGNIDAYGDRIVPGAFLDTFAQRGTKILHLWSHDFFSPPIAVVKGLREIGRDALPEEIRTEFPDAMGGAEADSEFLEDERSDAIFRAIKAGSPMQASFGYDPVRFDFEEIQEERIRNLRSLRMWELSTVLWGANDATLASKAQLPLDFLLKQFDLYTKAGARHSAADIKLLNAIHKAAVTLGATQCKGIAEEEADDKEEGKSRADSLSLTLLEADAFLAECFEIEAGLTLASRR